MKAALLKPLDSGRAIAVPSSSVRMASRVFIGLFLVTHLVLPLLFPMRADIVSLVFQILAPLLAAVACLARSRHDYFQGWIALALALTLWSGGLIVNLILFQFFDDRTFDTHFSVLFFVLYAVPIVFISASPVGERKSVRVVDALLATLLGVLYFIHSFAFATGSGSPENSRNLLVMFDLQNILIAVFALARFASTRNAHERSFFGSLSLYAIIYMVAAGYMNHVHHNTMYGASIDLLIDIPFLMLILLALQPTFASTSGFRLSPRQERIVLAVSPLMLPAMVLAVAALLLPIHTAWAVTGLAAATLVSGLRNVLTHIRNLEERDRLEQLSQIDTLTGLPNRRWIDERFRQEWSRARRAKTELAVLMIDIDHFKMLNDGLGHAEGDRCLRLVAQALSACSMRATDVVARYGGEEFIAIVPAATVDQTTQFADRMRESIHALKLNSPSPTGHITISVGIGHAVVLDHLQPEALLKAADDALYEAKRTGRDRVRVTSI